MNFIVKIPEAKEAETILRKYESRNGCDLCGGFHPLSYGGKYFCEDRHHFAHGPLGALSPREREIARLFGAKEEDL